MYKSKVQILAIRCTPSIPMRTDRPPRIDIPSSKVFLLCDKSKLTNPFKGLLPYISTAIYNSGLRSGGRQEDFSIYEFIVRLEQMKFSIHTHMGATRVLKAYYGLILGGFISMEDIRLTLQNKDTNFSVYQFYSWVYTHLIHKEQFPSRHS